MLPLPSKLKLLRQILYSGRSAVLVLFSTTAVGGIEFSTLPQLLDRGTHAFSQGDYHTAADTFAKIEELYSKEPEWESGALPTKLLPISGYTAFKASKYDLSSYHLELFLDEYSEDSPNENFASFCLALALTESGETAKAIEQFRSFRNSSVSIEQATVAVTHEARLLKETNQIKQANDLLVSTLAKSPAGRAKTQAALLLIRNYIENQQFDNAGTVLFETHWSENAMPELAVLSFSAIEVGDYLLQQNKPREALLCYRLVRDKVRLLELQKEAFAELEQRYETKRRELSMEAHLWDDFYGRVLHNTQSHLDALSNMEDYSEFLAIRKGKAFSNEKRYREAWLIFENLSQSVNDEISSIGFSNWIRSAKALERTEESIVIAKAHLQRHPESKEAANTLLDLGSSLVDLKRFDEALDVFTSIIESQQHPNLYYPALFQRAIIFVRLKQFPNARNDFALVSQSSDDNHFKTQAQNWVALTYFLEGSFRESLDHFKKNHSEFNKSRYKSESLYRIACCQFALGEIDNCIQSLYSYIESYPGFLREDETYLLLGDCYLEEGNFSEAIAYYQKVSSSFVDVYFHAHLQIAFAYELSGQVDQAIESLEQSLQHWTGTSHAIDSHHELARIFLGNGQWENAESTVTQVLQKHGNKVEAENILNCIQLLNKKENYFQNLSTLAHNTQQTNITLRCRLQLCQALFLKNQGKKHQAEVMLLELPNELEFEKLPIEVLAYSGLELARIQSPAGEEMLNHLLRYYPESKYINFAHYGLSITSKFDGDKILELAWLNKISQATPEFPYFQESQLAKGNALSLNHEYKSAQTVFEEILRQRTISSEHKAQALLGLARNEHLQADYEKSIAYYQRIYTLYPAYDNIVAESYTQSAVLFGKLGEAEKAANTCREFLRQKRFEAHPFKSQIELTLEQAMANLSAATQL
ncbi:tetratricopeptide repeat protein [Puniceicoccaceae bacterium K14]|nr:tetratricopeptide repeat protein [Puniceicoccaceae bacterium K14]